MRFLRLLLLIASGGLVLLGAAVALAFNSTFQTWLARKALASRPELRASVGAVSAGLNQVTLRDLRLERDGTVVTVPSLAIDLPVYTAGLDRKFKVSRLVARGWTVDLAQPQAIPAGAPSPRPVPVAAPPSAGGPAVVGSDVVRAPAPAFAGVLAQLSLPLEVSLDGVQLEGEVVLPESRGRTKVSIAGGGLGVGREGKFDLVADAVLVDPQVNAVELRATAISTMDTPRSFARVALKFDAKARGRQFPSGVALAGELKATRVAGGESYSATVMNQGREILGLSVDFPRNASRLSGAWKIDARDADVGPFALGVPLPAFTATGQGHLDCDTALAAVHASGRLVATVDRLEVLRPELAILGEVRIDADFDLAEHGGVLAVQRLVATLAAAQPVATIRTLQPFEFNPATGELKATDATRDLVGLSLLGLPMAWTKPFLNQVEISGGNVRGELVGMARGGGVALRSTAPISINGLAVARTARRLVENLDVAFATSVDYNPQGWHAELEGLTVRCNGATILSLDAKVGRLSGNAEALKATGKVSANLPALLAQPAVAGLVALSSGEAAVDFAASLGAIKELQAKVVLSNLAAVVESKPTVLPSLVADIRADLTADGRIAFSVPITIESNARKSDLALAGSFSPGQQNLGTIVASIASNQLFVEDARALAALVPAADRPAAAGPGAPAPAPPWAGLDGSVSLQLRQVVYSEMFRASHVSGRIELEAGKVKLEGGQAGLGDNGRANLNGVLTFDAAQSPPYALVAEVAIKEFDPVPLFQALNRGQPSTVEGRFDISSKLASRAGSWHELVAGAGGEFHLTSKGGVFRGLPASVSTTVGSTGRVAGLIAAAGNALGGLTGKKEYVVVSSKAQAIAEFAAGLNPIAFDQLSVVLARDAALNTTLRDFTLIAPEIRLTGGGTLLHQPDSSLLGDSLAMEFKLRARGRQGELLKYLGALEATPDALGYSLCTLPIRVDGTMGKPDARDLSSKLAALALEKTGVTEKASELFNKLIGGGK